MTARVQFEIENLNYYDLTKPHTDVGDVDHGMHSHVDKLAGQHRANIDKKKSSSNEILGADGLKELAGSMDEGIESVATGEAAESTAEGINGAASSAAEATSEATEATTEGAEEAADEVEDVANEVGDGELPSEDEQGTALLDIFKVDVEEQIDTVRKVLRRAIEETVKNTICNPASMMPAPAPAPAVASAPAVAVAPKIPPPVNAPAVAALLSTGTLRGHP